MEQRRNIEIPSTADLVFEESVSLEPPDTETLNIAALGGLPLTVACNSDFACERLITAGPPSLIRDKQLGRLEITLVAPVGEGVFQIDPEMAFAPSVFIKHSWTTVSPDDARPTTTVNLAVFVQGRRATRIELVESIPSSVRLLDEGLLIFTRRDACEGLYIPTSTGKPYATLVIEAEGLTRPLQGSVAQCTVQQMDNGMLNLSILRESGSAVLSALFHNQTSEAVDEYFYQVEWRLIATAPNVRELRAEFRVFLAQV